jgi:DNA-binding NarL/FixJ family response regulator
MAAPPVKVLIVEDHAILAHALTMLLDTSDDLEVVGVVSDGTDAVAAAAGADVVLMDIGLPGISGLEAMGRLRAAYPRLPVIALTGAEDEASRQAAAAAGAVDFLVKGGLHDDVPDAVRRAAGRLH